MLLTKRDDGRTVNVGAGAEIIVRLDENPTTGLRWSIDHSSGVELVADRFEPGGAIGAAGQRALTLRMLAVSTAELSLKLCRPWEADKSAQDAFRVRFSAH